MLEAVFENDNGKKYVFGPSGCTFYGMNIGEGLEINLGRSQGFAQIGETVETQSVEGRIISVTGQVYGNIIERKNSLRNVCAPFSSGRLVFNNQFFIRVYVKSAPTFSAVKNNGLFKMRFFAQQPFFYSTTESYYEIGGIKKNFRFPVNYGQPHKFGTRAAEKYVNVINSGDVAVPYKLVLYSTGISTNPKVTNLSNSTFIKFNGTINSGEYITMYRDSNNVLCAELTSGSEITNVISWIDENSNLFELKAGDNLLASTDDQSGAALVASFAFHEAKAALYET